MRKATETFYDIQLPSKAGVRGDFVLEALRAESAVWGNGHTHSGNCFNPFGNYLPLQVVKFLHIINSQFYIRDTFCNRYHARLCKGTKTVKAVVMRRRVCSRIRAAESPTVCQRMLNLTDAPPLLIKHLVIDHAANCKFRILFD